jgi:luciferase family oxidoreductase group 1
VDVRLSVLDRSRIRAGHDAAQALRDTVEFARRVEELGYERFWVSEHHGVPGIAGSAPTVLAAAIAAATSTIHVGTGGVMLPNHQPIVVAEQFGVLESLFPGRIDMGFGRSVGFTDGVRKALSREREAATDFGAQIQELLGYFLPEHTPRAYPAPGLPARPFLLATGAGAGIAARMGLPLVIAPIRGTRAMTEAIEDYRSTFTPSTWSESPYVIVSTSVAVADAEAKAWELLMSEAWSMAHARTQGDFPPLPKEKDVLTVPMTPKQRAIFDRAMTGHVYGTHAQVTAGLSELVAATGADEILVTTSTHDRERLLDSYARLAFL